MWGAAVILVCGLSSIPVTGQEMEEHSRKEVRNKTFSVGTNANLSVEGDVTDGCRFLFFLDDGACCFSAKERGDLLCDPFKQPEACRKKGSFSVEEQPGLCVLHLPDFQSSDVGKYQTVFPGGLGHNQDYIVSTDSISPEIVWPVCLSVVVIILFILIALLFLFKAYLWPMRYGGWKKRREKDEQILEVLLDRDSENVDDCVGGRNILRVRDKEGNNIFHYAAGHRADWTDRSTLLLDNELKKKRICLKEASESSPVTTADIFNAKATNQFDKRIPDLTVLDKLKSKTFTLDVNTQNDSGESPLHVACDKGNILQVEALLRNDARINVLDNSNSSPVHKAVSKNNIEIFKLLLPKEGSKEEANALLTQKDAKGLTPIGIAVTRGFDQIVNYIIKELEDETWKKEKVSLVFWACQNQYKTTLGILIANGAKWTKDWKVDDTSFLQKAAKNGNLEGVKTIMTKEYFTDDERIVVQNLIEPRIEVGDAKDNWKPILKILKEKAPFPYWKEAIYALDHMAS